MKIIALPLYNSKHEFLGSIEMNTSFVGDYNIVEYYAHDLFNRCYSIPYWNIEIITNLSNEFMPKLYVKCK